MDNLPRPEDGHTGPERYVPGTDFTKEAAIQTAINDVKYLMDLESRENASIITFDGSPDAREEIPSTRNRSDNICSSVHSQSLHFSPSLEGWTIFNTLGTSRNHSDSRGMAMNSPDLTLSRNRSASNYMLRNETIPYRTKSKPKNLAKCVEDLSVDSQQSKNSDEKLGLNETSQIAFHNRAVAGISGQNVEWYKDHSQIARKDNEQSHSSDVVASNSFCYSGGIFEASVSSGCHKDENTLNVVGEMSQSFNKGEIKSTKYEKVKALICGSCKEDIAQQVDEESVLGYVDSLYYNLEGTDLLIHRPTHVLKTTCNICGKEHAIGNLHKSEHRCLAPFCRMTFPCRTRLYQHIPKHGYYFKENCWVCSRTFKEHIAENDFITYVCCVCGFSTKRVSSLENHNILRHLPRCLCKICEKEYHVDDKELHVSEVKCFVCNYVFKCHFQLKEHFESHEKNIFENCRISERNKKKYLFRCPFPDCSQTLREVTFKDHLYKHAKLVFFECKTCGRQFSQSLSLNKHKPICKSLPYKCEICETRFSTIDLLHSHGLVKHKG